MTGLELRGVLGHESLESLVDAAQRDCLTQLRQSLKNEPSFKVAPRNSFVDNNAIQATFRGGIREPLHSWYPYLEGYSPQFVESVLQCYAPNAKSVLDPFAGVGTTPLTAARLGLRSFYCELNPLLQYLIETKSAVLRLNKTERQKVSARLLEVSREFPNSLCNREKNFEIQCSYYDTFGKSRFFDEDIFENVLQARALIDDLSCSEPIIAALVEWAVLAALVPCSRLVRRGDVRFKNEKELQKSRQELIPTVRQRLSQIALDVQAVDTITEGPVCLAYNARRVGQIPSIEAECLITSPPYLNGTNYFRNTKLELWFLNVLHTKSDLRFFRDDAVTAGICDVSIKRMICFKTPAIKQIVEKIEFGAYDPRIPRMVADYFEDLADIFEGVSHHLNNGARVIIDIGDSCYNGVHVPTDKLLRELLCELGYEPLDSTMLRRRCSRNGDQLHQVLLVFEKRQSSQVSKREAPRDKGWQAKWEAFKMEMPHQQQPYSKRNWGHPRHSLCSYQGKLKPSLAHFLIDTFLPKGGRVLDPFAGVGTIPFEASLRGDYSWSFDISPAAIAISRAKLGCADLAGCEAVICDLQSTIREKLVRSSDETAAAQIQFNKPLAEYFHPDTLNEIFAARTYFQKRHVKTSAEAMVFACLLHILHGNRPYALSRRSHPITPFAPTGPVVYRPLIPRLREKVERTLAIELPRQFRPGIIYDQDVTGWWPSDVNNLDAVITSPPFFDSTRFYLANWMRLWFCGWEARDFKVRPMAYIDEKQKQSFDVYKPFFRQARERLKLTGVVVMHLGKSYKCNMLDSLKSIALRWFRVADIFEESVEHCESHGIADKGTVKSHQFLVLQ